MQMNKRGVKWSVLRRLLFCGACIAILLNARGCMEDREIARIDRFCGNGICEPGETPFNCPKDCPFKVCGNNLCEPGEDMDNCPEDCSLVFCGDGVCEGRENYYNCPEDCPRNVCGNNLCEGGEELTCPYDCFPNSCGNGICETGETWRNCPQDCMETKKLDLLFVVDNSHSMQVHQEKLKVAVDEILQMFEAAGGGVLPDLHVGVVTSDLGAGNHTNIRYCEEVGGDKGILGQVGTVNMGDICIGEGRRYIVDVEPENCEVQMNNGVCVHDCTSMNCPDAGPGAGYLELRENENGCPRCVNHENGLFDAAACLSEVGVQGCGFEQHLEAMRLALDEDLTVENRGFLRDDALLGIVFVADEDDCSASQPNVLYNPDPTKDNINSSLGFLHSFRCFEFGIECHVNDRQPGERWNCRPREDVDALLYPVSRYKDFLLNLKHPGEIIILGIMGPVPEMIHVRMDSSFRPELEPSCIPPDSQYGADPAVRIRSLVQYFNTSQDMDGWADTSVCSSSFLGSMADFALRLGEKLADVYY